MIRDKKDSFLQTIVQSKKGMARPTKDLLVQKEKEAVVNLTADQPEESVTITKEGIMSQHRIEEEIRRTVRELFSGHHVTEADKTAAFFPSTSANYINNRKNAGSVGAILDHPEIQRLRQPGGYIERNEHMPTLEPILYNVTPGWEVDKIMEQFEQKEMENDITEHEQRMFQLLEEYPQGFSIIDYDVQTDSYKKQFERLWKTCLKIAEKEKNVAVPVALPEALKVRVITKGPPFKMFVLRFLQKKMHRILKEHPVFKLIGSPTGGEESMEAYLEKQLIQKGLGYLFLSGDYKAATDGLKSWASNAAAEEICKVLGLEESIQKLFIESLTGYWIEDKDKKLHKQTIGQLMGSITSFPVLCIVNAAISRMAVEWTTKQRITLDQIPMCINGDDIAMLMPKAIVPIWRKLTKSIGLVESVGKSYYSEEFVQINSRHFAYKEGRLIATKFVNMGLVYGIKRSGLVGLSDLDDPEKTIGARYRELMEGCPPDIKDNVHKFFIKHHLKILKQTRLPWYVPEWIGGLGLTGYKNPSELDLRMATKIVLNWSKTEPIKLGSEPGLWKTWELAKKHVKFFTTDHKNEGVEEYQRLMKMECINLLMNSDIPLKALFKEKKGEKLIEKISHNEKLWRPKSGRLPAPMSLEDLTYRKKYKTLLNDFPETDSDVEHIDIEYI